MASLGGKCEFAAGAKELAKFPKADLEVRTGTEFSIGATSPILAVRVSGLFLSHGANRELSKITTLAFNFPMQSFGRIY